MTKKSSKDTFRDFVIDQLAGISELKCRRLFSGAGLYSGKRFFAIINHGRLYFHTSDATRSRYVRAGMDVLRPTAKRSLKHYYEVPPNVIEDREDLAQWAKESLKTVDA